MKTNETKHTPLPWIRRDANKPFQHELWYEPGDGLHSLIARTFTDTICDEHEGSGLINADFIVHACNNYERVKAERDELAAALRLIKKGEGTFDRDNYQFACNVLENLKLIATDAIAKLEAK